jgi:integrase/recombinase XerD
VSFGHQPGQPAANAGRRFPPDVLTAAEAGALIDACSLSSATGIRNRALIWILYRSGLRISEALALRPADVDLSRHFARVLNSKGKAVTRSFDPSADQALTWWLEDRTDLGIRGGPLFCTLRGGPLQAAYVRNLLHRLAGQAGIDKRVHPDGLRRAYAAQLEDAGLTVSEISRLLGHSSAAVTGRYLDDLTTDCVIAARAAKRAADIDRMNAEVDRLRRVLDASADRHNENIDRLRRLTGEDGLLGG